VELSSAWANLTEMASPTTKAEHLMPGPMATGTIAWSEESSMAWPR
jgi:hypothetical protein